MTAARALSAARKRLALTQAQTATLLGTSQANVSAYEKSQLQPGPLVEARIAAFAALTADSLYATYEAATLASLAAQLRADLHAARSEPDMLRLVIQASDDFARLTAPADRTLFLAEPSPTGSPAWDSLLAGLAVHLCRQARLERTPRWVRDSARALDSCWWVARDDLAVEVSGRGRPRAGNGARSRAGNRARATSRQRAQARALQEAIPSMRARGVILSRRELESV